MLTDKDPMATVAVKDLQSALPFYRDVLGLRPQGGPAMGTQVFNVGSGKLLVYQSQFAGTNLATSVTWGLGQDFDAVARNLVAKGVRFETYDSIPGKPDQDGVYSFDGNKVAWFKDPDGNTLHINSF